jgi:hypothetical protein
MRPANWLNIKGSYLLADGSLAAPENAAEGYDLRQEVENLLYGALAPKLMDKTSLSIEKCREHLAELLASGADGTESLRRSYELSVEEIASLCAITQRAVVDIEIARTVRFRCPHCSLIAADSFTSATPRCDIEPRSGAAKIPRDHISLRFLV